MLSLLLAFAVLIVGYFVYGAVTERVFAPDDRQTPAIAINDGVDCVPVKTWRAFLIQLLNISGTGPIFGALMGAVFGPVVFLWIVFGAILGGAVHDYLGGMISSRYEGGSVAELSGVFLGKAGKWIMRAFSIVLLVLVGTVFITSPAALLARLTPEALSTQVWMVVIIIYYILATLLPVNKLISRLYPVFGVILLVMAIGILGGLLISGGYEIPEMSLTNRNPEGLPIWPFMFVTVACGAISGFHATQSPIIAKCITSEKKGRVVFYGAMIAESSIALVWAAAGMAIYGVTGGLYEALNTAGPSGVVYDISTGLLGPAGGAIAIIGVIVCPISSGDTAFRSARLILAECTGLKQSKIKNRLLITLPLLATGVLLTQLDFDILWRYFAWSNQTLAMVALWVETAYLIKCAKRPVYSLLTALPAVFMSAVSTTYILMANEGFGIAAYIAYPIGGAFAGACAVLYVVVLAAKRAGADVGC